VVFSLRTGQQTFNDSLTIDRSQLFSAGAFRLPALPIGIVYAPPQGSLNANTIDYSDVNSVGTRIKLSNTSENSITSSDFITLSTFVGRAGKVIGAFSDLASSSSVTSLPETAKNAFKGFKAIADLVSVFVGSDDFTKTQSSTFVAETTLRPSTPRSSRWAPLLAWGRVKAIESSFSGTFVSLGLRTVTVLRCHFLVRTCT